MRLDKFLKTTRLIKRRTVAKELCSAGKVVVNRRVVKPSYEVEVGDVMELYLGMNIVTVKVLSVDEKEVLNNPKAGYELLSRTKNAN